MLVAVMMLVLRAVVGLAPGVNAAHLAFAGVQAVNVPVAEVNATVPGAAASVMVN